MNFHHYNRFVMKYQSENIKSIIKCNESKRFVNRRTKQIYCVVAVNTKTFVFKSLQKKMSVYSIYIHYIKIVSKKTNLYRK